MLASLLPLALSGWLACPPAPAAPVPGAAAIPAPTAFWPSQDRPGIAVLPFVNGGSFGPGREDISALEVGIQQMLITELQQNPSLRLVERGVLKQVLEEQDLARGGRVDPATAARVGRLVGARYAILGTFMDNFGNFRLDARIVNVETGEYVRAVRIEGERREHLYRLLVDMADLVVRGVNLPPLAQAEREGRRARNVPNDATLLFSHALAHAEDGRTAQAAELYRQIAERFPDYTEARDALKQLEEG